MGALEKRLCPGRRPPVCSASSRSKLGAFGRLAESHSCGRAICAAVRALAANSESKDDARQKNRPSQLQPRVGQAAYSFRNASTSSRLSSSVPIGQSLAVSPRRVNGLIRPARILLGREYVCRS